jgi:hypothetical protein
VEVIDEDSGCSTSFSFGAAFDPTLASEEVDLLQSQVSVYPNPNNGMFWVSMEFEESKEVEFEIFDVAGKPVFIQQPILVLEKGIQAFDISNLPEGIYYLRLNVDNQLITKRVVRM